MRWLCVGSSPPLPPPRPLRTQCLAHFDPHVHDDSGTFKNLWRWRICVWFVLFGALACSKGLVGTTADILKGVSGLGLGGLGLHPHCMMWLGNVQPKGKQQHAT